MELSEHRNPEYRLRHLMQHINCWFVYLQCGFFKRKKRDEMEKRMQHEGQVMVQNENNYEEDEETEKKPL